ncbi:MAG: hypothetical protein VB084_06195 [Syntrophomonadaceae bacterium]|nr:hypothetical protein [Syntrophomonadaceae bacterium]
MHDFGVTGDYAAYIGGDINDLNGMKKVAVAGYPADASGTIKKISSYVCRAKGGEGAVREFIEWLIEEYK